MLPSDINSNAMKLGTRSARELGPVVEFVRVCIQLTVSSSTRVTPHYAMFQRKVTLPVDWVFPTPSVVKRSMYHRTELMEERQ